MVFETTPPPGRDEETNTGRSGPAPASPGYGKSRVLQRLPQERENRLRALVGLAQSRDAALRQDVVLRHVRRFLRDVGVTDTAVGRRVVHRLRLRQADGELETILERTDV